jgi:hypothetical protein
LLPGVVPANDASCPALGKRVISAPVSAMMTSAVRVLMQLDHVDRMPRRAKARVFRRSGADVKADCNGGCGRRFTVDLTGLYLYRGLDGSGGGLRVPSKSAVVWLRSVERGYFRRCGRSTTTSSSAGR